MEEIDSIKIAFEPGELTALNICLAFIMFGIALSLTLDDFKRILDYPRSVITGLTSQIILLPLLTFIFVWYLDLPASMSLGLFLVAACPGGNISNYATHFGRGNTALSITLTSIVTLLAILVTPFTFTFWSSFLPETEEIMKGITMAPLDMISTIGQLILLPLIFGMSLRRHFPRFAEKIRRPINVVSFVLFVGIIAVALYQNLTNMYKYLSLVFHIVLIHNALALTTGYTFSKYIGRLPREDCRAISLETGIQNAGLGLILVFQFFDALGGMMLIVAWWGLWDMIAALLISSYWRFLSTEKGAFFQTATGEESLKT